MFHSSTLQRSFLVLIMLLLACQSVTVRAAPPSGSYDDLFRASASKTTQVLTHESIVSFSIDGFTASVRKQIPGAPAKGPVSIIDLWARYSGYNTHMRMKGMLAAQMGANPEQGLELISVDGRTYIHGPAPQIGAAENRWYAADEYAAYAAYFEDLYVLQMLASNKLHLTRGGDERMDSIQCGIYQASDKKAARAAMLALFGGDVDAEAAGVQIIKPDLRVWICSDGYIHRVNVAFDLSCTCDDGDTQAGPIDRLVAYHPGVQRAPNTLSYALNMRYANMNRQFVILAPAAPSALSQTSNDYGADFATVSNGGNIRQAPNLKATILGQIHAGQIVFLLKRSADSRWFYVAAPEATGWVSASLLSIPAGVAERIPVSSQSQAPAQPSPTPGELRATVYNGGNVRDAPKPNAKVLDQINAHETVILLARTNDNSWYHITNPRNITGWVHRSLLTIDSTTAAKVPVAK